MRNPMESALTVFEADGAVLLNKQGERVDPETLRGTSVALLFSAGWCPDCINFLPFLREFYEKYNGSDSQSKVSIVYVSSDKSHQDATTCFQDEHGDWFMLEYESPSRQEYKQRHSIWAGVESNLFTTSRRGGIPALLVLTTEGSVAQYIDGEQGAESLARWCPNDCKWTPRSC